MSIPKRTMSRFLDDIWAWKSQYDQEVSDYWQEMREAIHEGNERKLTELRDTYFEKMMAAREASLTEINPEEAKGKERIVMAATVFCHIYASFDTNRKGVFNYPLFGKMLHDLEEGRSDPDLGHTCEFLLKAIGKKIQDTLPPLYDGSLEFLLTQYESWLSHIQAIWRGHSGTDRHDAIFKEFPEIKRLCDSDQFVGDALEPQYITLNILCRGQPSGRSNVADLKKTLREARKIRKALAVLNIEFARPIPGLCEFEQRLGQTGKPLILGRS